MTLRLTFGIDPGKSGAIAWLADGVPAGLIDMPVAGGRVDARSLAAQLRGVLQQHAGADVVAVHELVGGFRGQGGASQFAFGQSDGIVLGVLGALGIRVVEVRPQVWKKHHGLTKQRGGPDVGKDASRTRVISLFPDRALPYLRAKDDGRAEALLIALWAVQTEACAA